MLENLEPLRVSPFLAKYPRAFPEVPGPGVFRLVNPVAEAHDAVALVQKVLGVFGGVLRVADIQGHLHDLFGGPSVSGTFQGSHAGDDARMEV